MAGILFLCNMLYRTLLLLGSLCLLCLSGMAQSAPTRSYPRAARVEVSAIREDFRPELLRLSEGPEHSGNPTLLRQVKDSLDRRFPAREVALRPDTTLPEPEPVIARSFQGNGYDFAVPCDNDMAISNDGKIVSVVNNTLFFYDVAANASLGSVSLSAFSTGIGQANAKFDPKAIYDPIEDRFVVAFLNGFDSKTSLIVLAFSETNDPKGAWNLYSLPGKPFGDSLWTDFPMFILTGHELILTINLLHENMTWQAGFAETLIWQINKHDGYAGDSLRAGYHQNIGYGGKPIRNLCPVKGGSWLPSYPVYFMSNRNFAVQNDTFFVVTLADTLGTPGLSPQVRVVKANMPYSVPPDARQKYPHTFATNDARVLGAFVENDILQFVMNARDTTTGRAGIMHGLIEHATTDTTVSLHLISHPTTDYGYANLSWAGLAAEDRSAIISFNHSALNVFAGNSALFFNGYDRYSAPVTLKAGQGFINALTSSQERWGDYSGSQRKYSEVGVIWVSLTYGKLNNQPSTWITEMLANPQTIGIQPTRTLRSMELSPNPVQDQTEVRFEVQQRQMLSFTLTDMAGKFNRELLRTYAKPGENRFAFSLEPLPAGTYLLQITSVLSGEVVAVTRVVKQ